jgi:carbamate kinase
MAGGTAVVAIGGNALSPAGESAGVANQFRHTRESMDPIVEFASRGWNLAIVHGNGPQVGDELLRNERARDVVEELPLGVLVATTAGWIGYMIQQTLQNALVAAGQMREVLTVVTQVLVDPDDPATREPRKFIGRVLDEETAEALRAAGVCVEEDDRGRLRRRVPSPIPLAVVEADAIARLVAAGTIVVAAGGGGSPVYRDPHLGLEGVDAVIDKDLAAALLARDIGASVLLSLTDVEGVYRGFGTAEACLLRHLNVGEARELLGSGELGEGSMRPKVAAALQFVEEGGRQAIIAALGDAARAAAGEAGTVIEA